MKIFLKNRRLHLSCMRNRIKLLHRQSFITQFMAQNLQFLRYISLAAQNASTYVGDAPLSHPFVVTDRDRDGVGRDLSEN